jgi:hypothetical protein
VATYSGARGLWRPPADAFETISAVLSEHWRAAAGSRPLRLFWQTPANWLSLPAAVAAPVTISRRAADSSGRPPGPHRY